MMEPLVGFFWPTQTGEHSHRPEPTAVHGRLNPTGERVDSRETDVSRVVKIADIEWSVK